MVPLRILIVILLFWTIAPGQGKSKTELQREILKSRENAITRAIEKVSPTVAGISATVVREYVRTPFFRDPLWRMLFPEQIYRQKIKNLGSGFLISSDGYVLTNSHVIEEADEISVSLSDGNTYAAEVVGQDQVSDIALLKLDGKDFPYAVLGNSDKIIIGEWVVALGNPFGLFNMKNKPTPTIGIVSGVDLDFGVQEGGRVYQDMIQTDAAINTGNSGGPLVNILGEVIGINTFIFTSSQYSTGSIGIGFAIPINRAKNIVEELRKYGKIDRSFWTGLEVQNVNTLIAKYFNLKVTHGVIITDIDQDSPAQKAGLMIGDVIVEVNGRKVKSNNDIFRIIEEDFLKAGDMLTLKIVRGGETKMVSMRLGKTH